MDPDCHGSRRQSPRGFLAKNGLARGFGGLAVATSVGAAAVYAASPLWALASFGNAVVRGDGAAVSAMIDFPALRSSLRGEAQQVALERLTGHSEPGASLFGGLAAALMAPFVQGLVDNLVTPAGVQGLLDRQVSERQQPKPPAANPLGQLQQASHWLSHTQLGYRSWNRFGVTLRDSRQQRLDLTFARRGLVGWQLVAVDLPPDGTFSP